jgi:hypothetical protein
MKDQKTNYQYDETFEILSTKEVKSNQASNTFAYIFQYTDTCKRNCLSTKTASGVKTIVHFSVKFT